MKTFFLIFGTMAFLFLSILGLACILTDLSGMFFHYKDGNIYWIKSDKKVMQDTPENRRKISRYIGIFILVLVCVIYAVILIMTAFMPN